MLQQTRTIPIIFVNVGDPVGSGFVASLPRPGGNVTGFIVVEPTTAASHSSALARRSGARRRLPAGAEGVTGEVSGRPDPRRRLWRDLARPEKLERHRHPRARHR